ncbi:MAG: hypothetical protein JWQ04_3065 [Pedosphaera sp.]|nr:hypothetical protein [Pedosphaera sp.]
MKTIFPFAAILLVAGSIMAADSNTEVADAAKKLGQADNYSWKTTVESTGGRFRPGPTEGMTEKDGFTVLTITRGDNTTRAVLKGTQGALKTDGDWESLAEAAKDDGSGNFNAGRFMAMTLQNYKTPAVEAAQLAGKTKELKLAEGVYSGDLTEDGVKAMLTFGRGGNGPEVSDGKGSVKIWLKDGLVSKYEFKVQGHVEFNGNGRDINRTTTVEIKDVGKTKVEVPEEAKKKVS